MSNAEGGGVWERVLERQNLFAALKRVEANGGAPGIDGMTVGELHPYLKEHWLEMRASLEAGAYQLSPVRRVEIPKLGGGVRLLGIPTVLDRLIQQALAQALTPLFGREFSPHSYGFRRGRRAHDAVKVAQGYIREGNTWAVDVDLEKFFDRVNHDKLMARVAGVVLMAILSLLAANLLLKLCNTIYFRPRPFHAHPVNLLFYHPTDSSLPSNAATVGFALAVSVWLRNRGAGLGFILAALLFGLARIFCGVHYPGDVLAGALLGGGVAYALSRHSRSLDPLFDLALDIARRMCLA